MVKLVGVDVGGTFTDVVAVDESGIRTIKLATDRTNTADAVLAGALEIESADARFFNHASTRGLNAVITRQLPKIAFLTTFGHRDILDAGRTWRPAADQTNPHWRRRFGDTQLPLVPRYLRRGIMERVTAQGEILIELDEAQARAQIAVLRECAVEGVAICLLNSYVDPQHETRLKELVGEEMPGVPCAISSAVSPLAREYDRASTTVIDLLMRLIYEDYGQQLETGLQAMKFSGALNYANCAAQLLSAEVAMERPHQMVFAGPAAGTIASTHFGKMIAKGNLLCADIGGTSCDISLVSDFRPYVNTTFELEHDLIVNALSVEVSSIGAGGGSLAWVSPAGELQVGPGSAGSDPGPACYGKGGKRPTITDACLLMGILDPQNFAGGRFTLDPDLSRQAFRNLDSRLSLGDRIRHAFHVGLNNIAEGLANVAIQHGIDPRDFSIMAFGAAGPMLLPAVLESLKASEVIVPPHPGHFSALGLISSEQTYSDSRSAYRILAPDVAGEIDQVFLEMEENLRMRLRHTLDDPVFVRAFDGRLLGQSWETPFIPIPPGPVTGQVVKEMIGNFHATYELRSGNRFPSIPVQSVTYRIATIVPTEKVQYPRLERRIGKTPAPRRMIALEHLTETPIPAAEYWRSDLRCGDEIRGAAVIREPGATTLILSDQFMIVGAFGELRISSASSGTHH
ncbi:MAG: hydantoinase/oxoprolinase family protein [Novosphingobium sp.]|nr:hydantoinase/oxoprolinase family protein [Novosphingobium sp.]